MKKIEAPAPKGNTESIPSCESIVEKISNFPVGIKKGPFKKKICPLLEMHFKKKQYQSIADYLNLNYDKYGDKIDVDPVNAYSVARLLTYSRTHLIHQAGLVYRLIRNIDTTYLFFSEVGSTHPITSEGANDVLGKDRLKELNDAYAQHKEIITSSLKELEKHRPTSANTKIKFPESDTEFTKRMENEFPFSQQSEEVIKAIVKFIRFRMSLAKALTGHSFEDEFDAKIAELNAAKGY